jgi:hypothetical protein
MEVLVWAIASVGEDKCPSSIPFFFVSVEGRVTASPRRCLPKKQSSREIFPFNANKRSHGWVSSSLL